MNTPPPNTQTQHLNIYTVEYKRRLVYETLFHVACFFRIYNKLKMLFKNCLTSLYFLLCLGVLFSPCPRVIASDEKQEGWGMGTCDNYT